MLDRLSELFSGVLALGCDRKLFHGMRTLLAHSTFREIMENVRILFARPLKIGQCEFLGVFIYLVNLAWGFILAWDYDPNMDDIFFLQCQCIKNLILHALP